MTKAYEKMGDIVEAAMSDDGIDIIKLINFVNARETAAWERGHQAATELLTFSAAPKPLQQPDEYTEAELQTITGWKRQTMRAYRCRGVGIPYIKRGNKIFYKKADVETFMAGQYIK